MSLNLHVEKVKWSTSVEKVWPCVWFLSPHPRVMEWPLFEVLERKGLWKGRWGGIYINKSWVFKSLNIAGRAVENPKAERRNKIASALEGREEDEDGWEQCRCNLRAKLKKNKTVVGLLHTSIVLTCSAWCCKAVWGETYMSIGVDLGMPSQKQGQCFVWLVSIFAPFHVCGGNLPAIVFRHTASFLTL